ncbi:hypothetical protein BCR37DRAFT_343068 [Protomyces lactucae-debilis]|uniref:Uncharacterized protein n=1 Tax=Protomyces lactucae-debilis TaxID=2754530 RepID=A0A1Y2FSK5_PROLT|nr:uncharacterized protein BCR37DRAFT_343068 [Protomyces lactucae-debilis]ORY86963.1 hypothetical protein BCR37DRAFT_343068 [Protomyces lactucae-debilis]
MIGFRRDILAKNTGTCQKLYPEMLQGCEDGNLIVDGEDRYLFLACAANLHDRHEWFPAMGHADHPEKSIKDKFFAWNLNTDKIQELSTPNFKGDYVSHGIDVVSTNPKEVAFYAVNHLGSGSVIEKFTLKLGSKTMEHIKTFDDQEFVNTPNDVYVADVADDLFYVTNDHRFKTGLMREIETMAQLPTTHIAVHSNKAGGYRIVAKGLACLNGIAGDRKGRLFANQVNANVIVFDYETSGNLTGVQIIKVPHVVDNPTYSEETGELLLSGFPKALVLADFAKDTTGEKRAPTSSSRIKLSDIVKADAQTKSPVKQPFVDEWFVDPGLGLIDMGTTVVVDAKHDNWYMMGVFTKGVTRCTGYSKTQA